MPPHLPPEILLEIFAYLDPVDNRRDLFAICQVSRVFRGIAQPMLFKTFNTGGKTSSSAKTNDFEALTLFTRTVLSKPDLRNAVHRLVVRAEDSPGPWSGSTALSPDMLLGGLDDATRSLFSKTVTCEDITLVLLVLFSELENLEAFRVVFSQGWLYTLGDFFDSGVIRGHFSNLKSLDLSVVFDNQNEDFIRLEGIISILYLPNLEHFHVDHCIGNFEDLPGLGLSPGSINVSSISMVDSLIDHEVAENIIDACKSLKSFVYVGNPSFTESLESEPLNAEETILALQTQAPNLSTLRVQFHNLTAETVNWDRLTQLEPLENFSNLKHLHIDQGSLFNEPDLPASLETLVVEDCVRPVFKMVKFLVRENETNLRSLGKVTFKPPNSPCSYMLNLQVTAEEFENDEDVQTSFFMRAHKLERVAAKGSFKFIVECDDYQWCLSESWSEDEDSSDDDEYLEMASDDEGSFDEDDENSATVLSENEHS